MTYENIKKEAIELYKKGAYYDENKSLLVFNHLVWKSYTDEELNVIDESLKPLEKEERINDLIILLNCHQSMFQNSKFISIISKYREELMIIKKRDQIERENERK